ncbi:hypothetical protein, partial [Nocardia amamiensis]|uniref:hypothetical protein n=1 Tax=Nocardia amamiensis TaxID=404578 RepID=UPI0012F4E56C
MPLALRTAPSAGPAKTIRRGVVHPTVLVTLTVQTNPINPLNDADHPIGNPTDGSAAVIGIPNDAQ